MHLCVCCVRTYAHVRMYAYTCMHLYLIFPCGVSACICAWGWIYLYVCAHARRAASR